jgi:hypothetical protein
MLPRKCASTSRLPRSYPLVLTGTLHQKWCFSGQATVLNMHFRKIPINSGITYSCPTWEQLAEAYLLLRHGVKDVVGMCRAIRNLHTWARVQEPQAGFESSYRYNYITITTMLVRIPLVFCRENQSRGQTKGYVEEVRIKMESADYKHFRNSYIS